MDLVNIIYILIDDLLILKKVRRLKKWYNKNILKNKLKNRINQYKKIKYIFKFIYIQWNNI